MDVTRRVERLEERMATDGTDAVGMTESELAVEVRTRHHRRGARGVAFPVVVAAGPSGARPTQYRHGDRTVEAGDPVVLDFGAFFDGYASDQTRTVVFDGEPPEGFREAHAVVREALEAGVEAAEPGTSAAEVDRVVRGVVEAHGYGDAFVTGRATASASGRTNRRPSRRRRHGAPVGRGVQRRARHLSGGGVRRPSGDARRPRRGRCEGHQRLAYTWRPL